MNKYADNCKLVSKKNTHTPGYSDLFSKPFSTDSNFFETKGFILTKMLLCLLTVAGLIYATIFSEKCAWLVGLLIIRSSSPEVFLGKGVLKICNKFTGEHPCQKVIPVKLCSENMQQIYTHAEK